MVSHRAQRSTSPFLENIECLVTRSSLPLRRAGLDWSEAVFEKSREHVFTRPTGSDGNERSDGRFVFSERLRRSETGLPSAYLVRTAITYQSDERAAATNTYCSYLNLIRVTFATVLLAFFSLRSNRRHGQHGVCFSKTTSFPGGCCHIPKEHAKR